MKHPSIGMEMSASQIMIVLIPRGGSDMSGNVIEMKIGIATETNTVVEIRTAEATKLATTFQMTHLSRIIDVARVTVETKIVIAEAPDASARIHNPSIEIRTEIETETETETARRIHATNLNDRTPRVEVAKITEDIATKVLEAMKPSICLTDLMRGEDKSLGARAKRVIGVQIRIFWLKAWIRFLEGYLGKVRNEVDWCGVPKWTSGCLLGFDGATGSNMLLNG